MKKGVVMGSKGKWTVIMTPEGEFVKIPSQPQHIEGQEVMFSSSAVVARTQKRVWQQKWVPQVSLLAACLLFVMMVFPSFGGTQAYAAVTIDINPSIELEVNTDAEVIEAIFYNPEGQELLKEIEWKKQPLEKVTIQIIDVASIKGYMNEQKKVLITTTYYQAEGSTDIAHLVEDATANSEQEITVILVEGNKEWHEEAEEKNISPGSYILTKQTEQQGVHVEQDVVKTDVTKLSPVKGVKVIHHEAKPKKEKQDDVKKKSESESKAKDVKEDKKDKEKERKKEKEKDEDEKDDKKSDDDKVSKKVNKEQNKEREKEEREERKNKEDKEDEREKDRDKENQGSQGPSSHLKDDDQKKEREKDRDKERDKDKDKDKERDKEKD